MATIGQNAEIVVVIGGNFSGETVTVDGLDRDGYTAVFVYHASNNTSTAKFITDGALVNNEYTITATYAGNENYTGATATYTFTPAKISDYTIEVTGMNITYKDDEIITVTVPTGVTNVSIWVDGIKRTNSSFTPGEAKFNVTDLNLAAGVHYVNATVNDEDYASKVANNMFIVAPRNTTLYIAVHTMTIWDKEYVNVTIMDANGDVMTDASGKINITINGVEHPVEIVNGVARFNTANLVVGQNIVCAYYAGERNYVGNHSTKTFTVNQRTPKANVTATNVTVDNPTHIEVRIPANATGFVIITGNFTDKQIYLGQDKFTNGVATVDVGGLANGTYSAHIKYYGSANDNYTTVENDTSFTVSKLNATGIHVRADDITYAETAVVVITVPAGITGNITVQLNDTARTHITLPIFENKVVWNVSGLAAGKYKVNATYNGDYKYNINSTLSDTFEVKKAVPVITIDKAVTDANTSAVIIVHINDTATGKMNITVNNKNYTADIINGIANFTIDVLPVGEYNITANYYALTDTNYTVGNKTLVKGLNVTKVADYPMNVTAIDVAVGDNTTITVHVPVDAKGNVTIWVNGTMMTNATHGGVAIFHLNQTAAGKYTVNATLNDTKYGNKTVYTKYCVYKVDVPITIVKILPDKIYVNDTVTVTVTVPKDIKNNVTIEINGESYTNKSVDGTVVFHIPNITYGNKTLVVIYGGDNRYKYNSTTENFTVYKRDSFVKVNATDGVVDGEVTINVTVPANAIGYVVVNVNGTNYTINLTAGKDRVIIPVTEAGLYNVTVTYIGDDQYLSSKANTTFTVDKLDSFINVTATNEGVIPNGTDVDLFIKAPGDITGNVTVTVWDTVRDVNTTYTVYVNDGNGTLHIKAPEIGIYKVTAVYLENRKYLENENYTTLDVYNNRKQLEVLPGDVDVGEKKTVIVNVVGNHTGEYLTIIISNVSGEIIRNESVLLNYTSTLFNYTQATWELPLLDAGEYDVKAIFTEVDGLKIYTHEGNNTFKVKPLDTQLKIKEIKNITIGDNVTIELELSPGTATGNISVFVNGVEHKTTTDNLTITISNLKADTYDVVAIYHGNRNHNPSNNTTSFKVNKKQTPMEITAADLGDFVQVNVTVGNNASGQVLLDIGDGHYYANITNGVAQFNITGIKAGEHNATATYIENNEYYGNTTNTSFAVTKIKPEFTINGTNIKYGEAEEITIETEYKITSLVEVEINGRNVTTFIKDGKGTLILDNLEAGDYNITLYFPASDKYESATANNTFKVSQTALDIKVIASDIRYGEDEIITVYANASGNVTIEVGAYTFEEQVLENGFVTVTVPYLNADNYTVYVTYNGNDNHTVSYGQTEFEVEKIDPTIRIEVEDIYCGDVEHIIVYVNATGNVTIKLNGEVIGEPTLKDKGLLGWAIPKFDGIAKEDVAGLAEGKYIVEAIYNGNENYNTATAKADFNVYKNNATMKVDTGDYIKVGDNATITVTLPENATGNVTVEIDGRNYTSDDIKDGIVVFTIENLTYGNKTIAISYSGDGNYSSNVTSARLVVDKYESFVKPTIEPEITVGEDPTITVEVPEEATGWVIVEINNETYAIKVNNGTGSAVIKGLESGEYPINVTYLGDDKFFSSNSTTSIKVSKVPSTVNVTAENITVGDKAVINISTPADLYGNVTVSVNGENHTVYVSGGQGTLVLYDLPVGNYTVEAIFDGSTKYEPSNNTAKFEVSPITVNDIEVFDLGNGSIAIVAEGIEEGNVTVKVGDVTYNVTVINGTAVLDLSNNTPGTYDVIVDYAGDDTHAPATATASVTVPKYESQIEIEVGEATEGEPVIITVKVPENATGNVTVYIDGKEYPGEIDGGVAVVKVDNLTAGDKTIAVEYSGDGNYSESYAIGNFTVKTDKADSEIIVVDQGNGTVVVIVGDNATGNVTLTIDGENITVPVVDGVAVVDLGNVTPGTHDVEVIYSGDDTHKSATTETTVTAPKYDAEIEIDVGEATEGEPVTITVKVPEDATGNVTVYVGGKEYPAMVEGGVAIVKVDNLTAGDHTVTVKYSGDGNYTEETAISNFTVKADKVDSEITVVDYGNGTVVVIVGDNATGNVTLTIDGENITVPVVDGVAVVDLGNVTPGAHDVEVIYSGDDTHKPATTETTVTAPKYDTEIEIDVGEAVEGEPVTITVKVPEDATGNVTVYVGGKEYPAMVEGGVAIVKVDNLTAGDHTVAVEYSGDDNYSENYAIGNFTVKADKVDSEITVVDQGNGTVVVIVGDNAAGNVTLTIDGENITVPVVDGVAVW